MRLRRRWWVLVGVATFVLVGSATGVGVAAARYQPLEYGGLSMDVAGARVESFDLGPDAPEGLEDIPYHDGAVVTYGFDLANNGGWGVRITSFEPPPPITFFRALLKPFEVRLEPHIGPHGGDQGPTSDNDTVPFQPFDLGPGQDRWIVVRAHLTDCEFFSSGSSNVIYDQEIHFSFFAIDHEAHVRMRYVLRITSPPWSECPRPRSLPDVPTAAPLPTPDLQRTP